jgi:hypothetical protein
MGVDQSAFDFNMNDSGNVDDLDVIGLPVRRKKPNR